MRRPWWVVVSHAAADGAGWPWPEADGICARMGADGPHHRASCAGRGCTDHDGDC